MRNLLKLIDEFSSRTILPVEIDHIVEYLQTSGIKDEIYFFDSGRNAEVLKGTIMHWEYQARGWTYKVADIHTPASLSIEQKRVVQAKELLHILDQRIDRVNTPEDVEKLIVDMALHHSEIDWNAVSDAARSDHGGLLYALPVLFPAAARELLLPKLEAELITIDQISEIAALPKTFVQFIMSPLWASVYDGMMKALRAILPVPDRIHAIDANEITLDVHSVPLEDDPYTYAKRLEERTRDNTSIKKFVVQTPRERREFSRADLIAYTPWSGRLK